MSYIAVLGRQPEFGLAELESLFGADRVIPINDTLAQLNFAAPIPFERFGSIIKFAQVQTELARTDQAYLCSQIAQLIERLHPHEPGVKIKIGLSDYSNTFSSRAINAVGLQVKKVLKNSGYSVRIVPNKSAKLGSAHIIHNKLTGTHGSECLLFKKQSKLYLATTVYEQDIEGYAARDQVRPMRDARVGMLPPKLAQTIINLAIGPILDNEDDALKLEQSQDSTVLDPFCGTGVVLQEAALMGYHVYGTDLEERMIRYSRDNINWLQATHSIRFKWFLEVGDATNHTWRGPVDYIAAETYLGRPLSRMQDTNELADIIQGVNTLHKKFLANLHSQIAPSARICLALPAWRTPKGFKHLPVLDQIDKLGYNQLVFSHVNAHDLIYARDNQIVARQLVVLQKQAL